MGGFDESVMAITSRTGDAPYCDVREVCRVFREESVNEYLANNWTMIAAYASGSGHPKDNSMSMSYVLAWRHELPSWKPEPRSDW